LIATVSMYGMLADPADVARQVNRLGMAVPGTARLLLIQQLNEIQKGSDVGLRFGFFLSMAIALFSASGGVAALMRGINKAYDEEESRGWIRFRVLALLFTVGFAAFVISSVGLITLLPTALTYVGLDASARAMLQAARWPALAVATIAGLGILYRYAPNRTPAKWAWVTSGALVATIIWTLASLSFSLYADNFGRFNKTYGTLGGAVVLGLWMFLSAFAILLGAELNSELERQTEEDTTIGPTRPIGQRGATVADQVGEPRPAFSPSDRMRDVLLDKLAELNRPRRGKQTSDE
jgi:membrane protein